MERINEEDSCVSSITTGVMIFRYFITESLVFIEKLCLLPYNVCISDANRGDDSQVFYNRITDFHWEIVSPTAQRLHLRLSKPPSLLPQEEKCSKIFLFGEIYPNPLEWDSWDSHKDWYRKHWVSSNRNITFKQLGRCTSWLPICWSSISW